MLEALLNFDVLITKGITDSIPHNTVFDLFFAMLSLRGAFIFIWGAIILFFIIRHWKKNKNFVWYFMLSALSMRVINDLLLKNIFHRTRPIPPEASSLLACPTDFGFPSYHAAGAFAAAVIFTHFDKQRGWLYFVIAGLVSLSRIYLGCHYLFDVVAGAFVGMIISHLIIGIHKKYGSKKEHLTK